MKKLVKFMRLVFVVCLLFGITACSVPVKNPDVADCGPWLFGIAKASSEQKQFPPSSWAVADRLTCLKTVYAQGFNEFDPADDERFTYRSMEAGVQRKPIRPAIIADGTTSKISAPIKIATPIDALNLSTELPRFSLTSATHQFEFATPSKWELAPSPSPLYQLFAKNRENRAALFISMHDVNPFLIWSDARDSMYLRVRFELAYSDVTRVKEVTLNGLNAFQIEYRGRDKDGVPLHFLSTQIRLGNKLIYLTSWCFESDYVKNENEFHLIARSLVAKPKLFAW